MSLPLRERAGARRGKLRFAVNEVTKAIFSRERSSPKTVLAFYGFVLAVIAFACAPVVAALAGESDLHHLIPYVIIGAFALFVVIVSVVTWVVLFGDPTRLQLGEVSASEYREYQRMMLGDSVAGVHPIVESRQAGIPQVTGEGATGNGTENGGGG